MAKVSKRTKQVEQNPDDDIGSIFDHFEATGRTEATVEKDEAPKVREQGSQPSVQDILGQLKTLQDRLDRSERTNIALMTQAPGSGSEHTPAKIPDVDFSKLPDPTLDPKGYGEGLIAAVNMRAERIAEDKVAGLRQERTQEDDLQGLWKDFSTRYEPYSEDQEKLEFVTLQVVKEAQKKGIDVKKYMFQGREQFFEDVKTRYVKVFGDVNANEEHDTPVNRRNEEPATRTAGIFGGVESGGKPTSGTDEDKPGDMLADLQALQRKQGFL